MNLNACPCCGNKTLTERNNYEICEVYGWEDDDIQSDDPDFTDGANHISLNEARAAWAEGKPLEPLFKVGWQRLNERVSAGLTGEHEYWERVVYKHAPDPLAVLNRETGEKRPVLELEALAK
jgi:hypothetical protein